MKLLDCEQRSVDIHLPPCAGDEPTAQICRPNHVSVLLVHTVVDGNHRFAFPDPFPAHIPYPQRGVWKLSVTTGCGCYEAPVYVDCPPPAFVSTHIPTPQPQAAPCCEQDGDIVVEIITLDPPTIEVEGYPSASLLVNDAAAYAIRLANAITGPYTLHDESGVELAAGTFQALGTTEYHAIDLTCAAYLLRRPTGEA